jgi:nucleoside-diphosphate-sugar epimerase
MSCFNHFDIPEIIVCISNACGPRQSTKAVIPRILNQLVNNTNSFKLGNSTTIRDFNYIQDIVDAVIL